MENPAATPASSNVIPTGHAALTTEDEVGEYRPDASTGLAGLSVAALGVVFGDIGTSRLASRGRRATDCMIDFKAVGVVETAFPRSAALAGRYLLGPGGGRGSLNYPSNRVRLAAKGAAKRRATR